MSKLYKSDNYVIAEKGGKTYEYSIGKTVYTRNDEGGIDKVELIESEVGARAAGRLVIPISEITAGDWENDLAVVYTEGTFITFLRTSTGFNPGGATTFTELTDVPSYLGNALKGLRINAAQNALEAYTATDLNQWLIPSVAFVSPTGNNGTAQVGNGNLPFLTVSAAQLVATTIFILPGTYTETITLQTLTTYYCFPGVKFTSGGLRAPATPLIETKWLGYADFIGNFRQIYLLSMTATNLKLEWNTSIETGSTARCFFIDGLGATTFEANCRNITIYSGGAYGIRVQKIVSGVLNVREFIKGSYGLVYLGIGGAELNGKITVNCPRIICSDGGFVGNNSAFKQAVISGGMAVGTIVTINGDIYDEVLTLIGSVSGNISVTGGPGGTLIHNGNIYGTGLYGVNSSGANANIIQNGDINTTNSPYIGTNGITLIKNAKIVTNTASNLANANPTLYIRECSQYNAVAGNAIVHASGSNKLFVENCTFEVQAGSECIDTGGVASSAGLINVVSTVINDVALLSNYTAPGFTVEPNLNVPKF